MSYINLDLETHICADVVRVTNTDRHRVTVTLKAAGFQSMTADYYRSEALHVAWTILKHTAHAYLSHLGAALAKVVKRG